MVRSPWGEGRVGELGKGKSPSWSPAISCAEGVSRFPEDRGRTAALKSPWRQPRGAELPQLQAGGCESSEGPEWKKESVSCSVVSDSLWAHGLYPARFPVHGTLQTRIVEWVAIPFSRGSAQPNNWTWVSCTAGRSFTVWATKEALRDQNSIFQNAGPPISGSQYQFRGWRPAFILPELNRTQCEGGCTFVPVCVASGIFLSVGHCQKLREPLTQRINCPDSSKLAPDIPQVNRWSPTTPKRGEKKGGSGWTSVLGAPHPNSWRQ